MATVTFLVLGILGQLSSAAKVQFTDCLTTSDPNAQHFTPYNVDAKFGGSNDDFPLSFEVHGNLTSGPPIANISYDKISTYLVLIRLTSVELANFT